MFSGMTIRRLIAAWLLIMAVGLVIAYGVIPSADWLPAAGSQAGRGLLKKYNSISHLVFLILLAISCGILYKSAQISRQSQAHHPSQKTSNLTSFINGVKRHPIVTGLFAGYTVIMVRQASWFYKEIIGWYEDILAGHLLDNFTLRWNFVKETMFRNDFRFFPLSHQDLHILSWFTPYVSIWMLINAVELFAIIIIGSQTVKLLTNKINRNETLLIFSILFLFDAATGFTFFQFIYSERIVTLLLALFCFFYTRSFQFNQRSDHYLCLLVALLGLFFKDTGFLLFTIPAFTVLAAGSAGFVEGKPKLKSDSISQWCQAYDLELWICGLIGVLAASYLFLSYLPSLYAGVDAYDSHLRWSRFEADLRFIVLLITAAIRITLIAKRKLNFSALDAFNTGGIAYAFGLFAMVGFRSSNYMALPVQFISTLNLVVLATWFSDWLQNKNVKSGAIGIGAVIASGSWIGVEHLERRDFQQRIGKMHDNQDSWVKTLDQMDKISQQALLDGDEINIIYSKSWFRNRGHLERLKYNRLVYYDLDSGSYTVMDGTGKGQAYIPKRGDFLLNIDTGNRLNDFGFDMSPYQKIWDYGEKKSNGKIYRRSQ